MEVVLLIRLGYVVTLLKAEHKNINEKHSKFKKGKSWQNMSSCAVPK